MSGPSIFDSPEVCDVLDEFFKDPSQEPDWEAVRLRLMSTSAGLYGVTVDLLKAFYFIYEDSSSGFGRLFQEKHGL